MQHTSAALDFEAGASQVEREMVWPALTAALLGLIVLGAVGFAPGIAHNAAHDVRHTFVFPCH